MKDLSAQWSSRFLAHSELARSQELEAYFEEFDAIFLTMASTSLRSLSLRLVE